MTKPKYAAFTYISYYLRALEKFLILHRISNLFVCVICNSRAEVELLIYF